MARILALILASLLLAALPAGAQSTMTPAQKAALAAGIAAETDPEFVGAGTLNVTYTARLTTT